MVSDDQRVVLVQVVIQGDSDDADEKIDAILGTVRAAADEADGLEIAMGGQTSIEKQSNDLLEKDFARIMMVTLVLGLVILLIAFRAVVAALVPLVLAIGSIFVATSIAAIVSQAYPLDESYSEMILLMGMAVGIDYSLFIISRFRSERKAGRPKLDAIAVASDTTGRAVFYAGVTVMQSLVGLMMTSNPIFISLALGAIIVVLIALVGSLTLVPAILGILGDNINRLRVPIIGRERPESNGGGFWGAITDRVLARPGVLATVAVAALILAALPVASLDLGFNSGSDAFPDAVEGKRALELLEEHFTAGLAQPAYLVVDAPDVRSPGVKPSVDRLIESMDKAESFFTPFDVVSTDAGDLLYVTVPMVGEIDYEVSANAVKHLRNDIIPAAFAGSDAAVYVSGASAGSMDFKDHMYKRAPYVFGFVLVAVFQWGWGISLLGAESTGVIEAWLPLFLFGILFGLSMDYHMLILSRIKEAYDHGLSNDESVSTGIKITDGQITSAAAIMVGVFGSFALASNIGMKQFGLGLGVAVLIDATVIRSVLLPASMKLLGDSNWYLPRWLEWLPRLGPEGGESQEPQPEYRYPEALPALEAAPGGAGD